jgi:hypothetical protein
VSDRIRRNLPLVMAAPLLGSTVPLLTRAHVSVLGASPDAVAGVVAGFGIGLALVGLIRMRRASACD